MSLWLGSAAHAVPSGRPAQAAAAADGTVWLQVNSTAMGDLDPERSRKCSAGILPAPDCRLGPLLHKRHHIDRRAENSGMLCTSPVRLRPEYNVIPTGRYRA